MDRPSVKKIRWAAAILLAGILPAAALAQPVAGIQKRLARRMTWFEGDLGIAAKNLDTGETIAIRGDERFPTASLIKVGVMVEAYHQIAEGKLRSETAVTLRESDKAGDEAVPLNMMHAGVSLTTADLLRLMIAYSDNTATNLLIGLVGTANVDRRMDAYGLPNTRLFRPTFRDGQADVLPQLEKEFGLGMTTPREIARLFELIAQGKVVSRAVCDEMLETLERQQDRAMIPRLLPLERDHVVVANKTGWDEEKLPDAAGFKGEIRTDAAYVRSPKVRYVIAICVPRGRDTRATVDNDALVTGAELSRMVYEYFDGLSKRR